jgi:hypothetical protein
LIPENRQLHHEDTVFEAIAAGGWRGVQIVGVDEFDRAVADHLIRPIADDGKRAWRDLDEVAGGVLLLAKPYRRPELARMLRVALAS